MKIENAKITNVSISMTNYGCFTFYLTLEGYNWNTRYGGYYIGKGYLGADEFSAENGSGLVAMMRIMDTIGVEKWEDLVGKYCRVKTEGWGGKITTIGNIMNDKWFDIDKFFKEYKEEEGGNR